MNGAERTNVAGLELTWMEFGPATATGAAFGLWVLVDPDVLLDQITEAEYYSHDERMPYFGAIWPSAEALVRELLDGAPLDGRAVLDLGCGLGPVGFAAAARGARVTFMDWEPRALEIVRASAQRQPLPADRFDFVVADWRKPPPLGPFDLVLGADVLYEERNAPAVAGFLARHLKPRAEAWIADPGRPHARRFPALAQLQGIRQIAGELLPARAGAPQISLMKLQRSFLGPE